MKEFDDALLQSGELIRRGVKTIIENVGKVVASITVLVTALVLFCDVGFADFRSERFTSTLTVMLIASYLMYFSMYDAGEESGKRCEEYISLNERYKTLAGKIEGKHLNGLRAYLTDYAKEEADFRRCALLMRHGYSHEDYEAYKKGGEFPKSAKKAFKAADRVKNEPLSLSALLSGNGKERSKENANPEDRKPITALVKLLPMTLCSIFTVSVMLTAKSGLSAANVIEGLFKISSLLIIGLRGYFSGYTYVRLTLPTWLDTKSRLLDGFLKQYANEIPINDR